MSVYEALELMIRDRRLAAWTSCKALLDAAAREGRPFTQEEQDHWDELNATITTLDERISRFAQFREGLVQKPDIVLVVRPLTYQEIMR